MTSEAVVWMRMSDADLAQYGGPEWVGFDAGELYNTPASQLEAYEAEIGFKLHYLLAELLDNGTRATRAALFIARRRAGQEERYADFDPHTMQVMRRLTKPGSPTAEAGPAKAGRGKSRRATPSPDGSEGEASPKSSTTSAQY